MKKNFFKLFAIIMCLVMVISVVACTENGDDAESETTNGSVSSSFSVKYNGAEIKLGAKWSDVEGKLGAPMGSIDVGDCGGRGRTYRYDYSSIAVIVVYYTDGDAVIDQVIVRTDAAITEKGIYIGSAKSDVTAAYGTPSIENETSIQYVSGNAEFTFGIANGKVDSITLTQKG